MVEADVICLIEGSTVCSYAAISNVLRSAHCALHLQMTEYENTFYHPIDFPFSIFNHSQINNLKMGDGFLEMNFRSEELPLFFESLHLRPCS